jgi:hypothetical protein
MYYDVCNRPGASILHLDIDGLFRYINLQCGFVYRFSSGFPAFDLDCRALAYLVNQHQWLLNKGLLLLSLRDFAESIHQTILAAGMFWGTVLYF